MPDQKIPGKKLPFTVFVLAVILAAAASCRTHDKAGGPLPENGLNDGRYHGRASYGPVRVKAAVTIREGAIADIELVRHFRGKGGKAEQTVIESIIRQQSTRVDAVTGATGSSIAIMNAVEQAIERARR